MRLKKPGAHANGSEYINRNNKIAISCIHRSVTFYPKINKFAVELSAYKGKLDSKIEVNHARCFRDTRDQSFTFCSSLFFFFFSHKHKNHFISGIHTLIQLKFGTRAEQLKEIISTKFCEDSTKMLVVINDYLRKQRLICWPGKPLLGSTWKLVCITMFNIRGVPFGG